MWLTGAVAARYCRRCGEALAPDAVYCAACGSAVAYSPGTTAAETAAPPAVVASGWALADYGQRVAAWLIDCVIVYGVALAVAVTVILIAVPDGKLSESGQTGVGLLIGLTAPLYSATLQGLWHGQTVGKRCVRIAVRRRDLTEIGLGRSFLRSYARAAAWLFFPVWVLDSLWPLWERNRRALHDLVADTIVVDRPRGSM
jgi:uncharacterized RDD family membrane protein YckC